MWMYKRDKRNQRGITLIEAALALIVGAIVTAAALTAFQFVKISAIRQKQLRNVQMFKSLVEQIKASQSQGAPENFAISNTQLSTYLDKIPGLKKDPYRGTDRVLFTGANGNNSVYATVGPATPAGPITSVQDINGSLVNSSDLIYVYGATPTTKFSVLTADGVTQEYTGFVVLESDSNGKISAAAGGGGDE